MSISDLPSPISSSSPSSSDSEVLVRVENVSKKFCRSLKKSLWYGVKDIAHELNPFGRKMEDRRWEIGDSPSPISDLPSSSKSPISHLPSPAASPISDSSGLRPDEFWAVRDVSFELRRGECLGLIGHNGAGKTTLLKMLNGLIKPDGGRIEMRGRVGALIALGAGFNPILTGRENIYVNASILGLSKREINEKLDEIIDFAEIGEFIDAPVQSYSSGMQVRLGFSVASALKPDVLILDEVLAVGDDNFRTKCLLRITECLKDTSVIFVSHQRSQISRICTRAIWIDKGKVLETGSAKAVCANYSLAKDVLCEGATVQHQNSSSIRIKKISILSKAISVGETLLLEFELESGRNEGFDTIQLGVEDEFGNLIAQSSYHCGFIRLAGSISIFQVKLYSLRLNGGRYHINFNILENNGRRYLVRAVKCASFDCRNQENITLAAYQPEIELIRTAKRDANRLT